MTVINTNYSSLEDAWGDNFNVNTGTKKHRKSKKETAVSSSDPLCELYGKRYRKIKKPYGSKSSTPLDDEYVHRYNVYKGDDRRHYYGYDDDDYSKLMDSSRQDTNLLIVDPKNDAEERCVDVNAIPMKRSSRNASKSKSSRKRASTRKVRFIEPEDEDDVYLQNAITSSQEEDINDDVDLGEHTTTFDEEMDSKRTMFDRIYSNVYNESEDETEVLEEDSVNVDSIDTEDDEDLKLIAKEVKRKSQVAKARTGEFMEDDNNKERNYLDFIIYILSGFILIFMMEQFIQIGIQMRLR